MSIQAQFDLNPGAFVLTPNGSYAFETGSLLALELPQEIVKILSAKQPFSEPFTFKPAVALRLADEMLIGIGNVPQKEEQAAVGRPSVFMHGGWYVLDGIPSFTSKPHIVELKGQRNKGHPQWPQEQTLFVFRLSNGVMLSWGDKA